MKRGDIYWAALAPRSGSEQRGHRPVIIVSHDSFNTTETWRSLIVVPLSRSSSQARRSFSVVPLGGRNDLDGESVALCHQVTTLDRSKLQTFIGRLSEAEAEAVDEALRAALQLL